METNKHTIAATELCVGDRIAFEQRLSGSMRTIYATVADIGRSRRVKSIFQLTLERPAPEIRGACRVLKARSCGEKMSIAAGALFRRGVLRRPWAKEDEREIRLAEGRKYKADLDRLYALAERYIGQRCNLPSWADFSD